MSNASIGLYLHGGSKNHGCEALVRSTHKILGGDILLFSYRPEEDIEYGIDKICRVEGNGGEFKPYSFQHIIAKLYQMATRKIDYYLRPTYKNLLSSNEALYLSIGGDNYCYDGAPASLEYVNSALCIKKTKLVLWGCSIEPTLLTNHSIIEDLNRYALITARESITYNALLEAGVTAEIKLYPDPAFQLDKVELPMPEGFVEGNTVGINLSPLIIGCEENAGITYRAYEALIGHIINTTDMQVALIPHVVVQHNDDRAPLLQLFNQFQASGRVVIIDDHNCMELKGYIARCRMFIGARTHATIAAYSTCVPTLVVGYSVKAKGIAQDIFGTHKDYVIPVQSLSNADDLINAFEWLQSHEGNIRNHLEAFMPAYIDKAGKAGEEIRKLL